MRQYSRDLSETPEVALLMASTAGAGCSAMHFVLNSWTASASRDSLGGHGPRKRCGNNVETNEKNKMVE